MQAKKPRKPQLNIQLSEAEDAALAELENKVNVPRGQIVRSMIAELITLYRKKRRLTLPLTIAETAAADEESPKESGPTKPTYPVIDPPSASKQAHPNPSRRSRSA